MKKFHFSVRLITILLAICTQISTAQNPKNNSATGFFNTTSFDKTIPAPETVIGLPTGLNTTKYSPNHAYSQVIRHKAISYDALLKYMQKLAKTSNRVILTEYGKSHEGRTLYHLTITSPANHKNLNNIKSHNAKLADPRKLTDKDDPAVIIKKIPAVAWLGYSIHGDELSSTDAAMYIAYKLAADTDKKTTTLLDQLIINIVPLMNPDGRERYLSQLHQLSGIIENSDYQAMQHRGLWSRGRGNHYLFDLNRDWLIFEHPETRTLAKAIQSWNPHLLVDSHEMGGLNTYLFDPPSEPINSNLSPQNVPWRTRFSADQAAAFNSFGWSYYTREWYTDWGPFYTSSWANLLGSVGLLYEQARANGADVKQYTGHVTTYRQTVHHHIVSSFANLETLRKNRQQIMLDFHEDRKWAVNDTGDDAKVFLVPPTKYPNTKFMQAIANHGIEVQFAGTPFKAHGVIDINGNKQDYMQFPAQTAIIRSNQPHRRLLQSILDFDPKLKDQALEYERRQIEKHNGSHLYDVSSWNLAMACNVKAYWADVVGEDIPQVVGEDIPQMEKCCGTIYIDQLRNAKYGYLIELDSGEVYKALVTLFENNCNPRIATKPFTLNKRKFKAGTVILRKHENPKDLYNILKAVCQDYCIEIIPTDSALVNAGTDLGGPRMQLLQQPRVAIASQWPVSSYSFGSVWHLLDHDTHLRTSPFNIQYLSGIDLRKYNVLILPNSRSLASVLDDGAIQKIKRWVEAGGTLIALGNSAAFAANEKSALSSVKLKRDVLDKLDEYSDALDKERNARSATVDPKLVWGEASEKEEPSNESSPAKKNPEALKRTDQWQRMFSPSGVFLSADIDPEHWLGFASGDNLPVMFYGSSAFMSKYPIATPVRFSDKDNLRLSGLLWPEAKERIAGSAYATVENKGHGQIILFAADPTYRAWLAGAERLFLNAVILGPGMGTSPPVPW